MDKEYEVPLEFPSKGVAVDAPLSEQLGSTTPLGKNVRFHESQTQRGRGGSRSGIERYIDEQVSGSNKIQMLDFVVRTDGNALDWHFEGEEFSATGLYLGLDLTGIAGDSQPTGGGGGFQPSASFKDHRVRLSLATSHTTRVVGQSITITGTVTNENGAPVGLKRVVIHTSPGGRPADRDETTSSLIDGTAPISNIKNDRAETVKYLGTVEDVLGRAETRSRNAVQCVWTEPAIAFVQARSGLFEIPSPSAAKTLAFTSGVTAGNTLLVIDQDDRFLSGLQSVTDSQGNTYTKYADPSVGVAVWAATASATGACTVNLAYVNNVGTLIVVALIAEYENVSLSAPIGARVGQTATSASWSTTPITVSIANSAVIGYFQAVRTIVVDPALPSLSPDAGFTERLEATHTDGSSLFDVKVGLYDKIGVSSDQAVTVTASVSKLYSSMGFPLQP